MTKSTLAGMVMAALMLASASRAAAQTAGAPDSDFFFSAEIGAQPQQRTIEGTSSFPLYDETATVTTEQDVHNGAIFGFNAGYRLQRNLGVAIGVTWFHAREGDALVTASIPDPIAYNQPKIVTTTATGLKHSEVGVHLQAVWFHPVNDKFEVVLAGGPSIIKVKQDLAIDVTVPPGTQNVVVAPRTESKNAFGFNAGFEGNYFFTPQYGLGLVLRYAGASADLPSVPDLAIGGLQVGLGLRLRF